MGLLVYLLFLFNKMRSLENAPFSFGRNYAALKAQLDAPEQSGCERFIFPKGQMERDLRKTVLLRLFSPSNSDRSVFRERVRGHRLR
jgi:hypothetical protein